MTVYVAQVLFSVVAEALSIRPIEWLWRTLMYGAAQSMSISAGTAAA